MRQLMRRYFSGPSAPQQPASWLQPTAHASFAADPAATGLLPSLLSLVVVAGVLGTFCYVACSEVLRRNPGRAAQPAAGGPQVSITVAARAPSRRQPSSTNNSELSGSCSDLMFAWSHCPWPRSSRPWLHGPAPKLLQQ